MEKRYKFALWIDRNASGILRALVLAGLLGGACYSLYIGEVFRFYDEEEYLRIAQYIVDKGMVSNNGVDPSSWRPPGYPFLLAFFIYFGANIAALRLVNFLFLAASMVLVYKILEERSRIAAVFAVFFMLFYPVFFFTASTLYPQTMVTTLFLASIYLLYRKRPLAWGTAVQIGALYGVMILTVVTFVGSLLITLGWLIFALKDSWKHAVLIAATALLVLAPWSIRNYIVFDAFIPVATNGGVALILGNSPQTKPNAGGTISLPALDKEKLGTELEIHRYYTQRAIGYMLENKWQTVKMYFLKFLNHFNFSNELMTETQASALRNAVLFCTFVPLLLLALSRLVLAYRDPLCNLDVYLILLYLGHAAMMALFITRIRYRLPYDPILAVLAGESVRILLTEKWRRAGSTLPE